MEQLLLLAIAIRLELMPDVSRNSHCSTRSERLRATHVPHVEPLSTVDGAVSGLGN
jgi:hypothetical protein